MKILFIQVKRRERERERKCERGVTPIVSGRIEIFETLRGLCRRRVQTVVESGGEARQGRTSQDTTRPAQNGTGGRRCACTNHAKNDAASHRPAPSHLPDETLLSLLSFLSFFSSRLLSFPLGGVLHSCCMHHRTGVRGARGVGETSCRTALDAFVAY